MRTVIRNARVITNLPPGAAFGDHEIAPPPPRRGRTLGDLGVELADVVIERGVIAAVRPSSSKASARARDDADIDAAGRILMPAFVDCHTHACFAGSRLAEWEMKLKGAKYLDILKAGGGIMSTVRAVRDASENELAALLRARLDRFAALGTMTLEVKSGYGLSTRDELKMLRAIRTAARDWPGTLIPTALLGHALDPDVHDFIDRTINETLPAVSAEFPGITIDAFCEDGAWSLADCVRLFERARALGHSIRVHADQFNSLGMLREAIRLGARSVDHLEATTPADAEALAASNTFAVGLPCCGLHLANRAGGPFADLRRLADANALIAIATNFNPGSAPVKSMFTAIAAAVRGCGLTPQEAIAAATLNSANILGLPDRGWIGPGARADLLMLDYTDERAIAFEIGDNPIAMRWCAGVVS